MKKMILLIAFTIVVMAQAQSGKIGINTEKPLATLSVKSLVTNTDGKNLDLRNAINEPLVIVSDSGNMVIGSEIPSSRLDVKGYIRVGSSDALGDQNPQQGMIRYNATTEKFQVYVAGTRNAWVDLH